MPVILDTQETEIKKIEVQSQPEVIVHETLSQNRAGGVAQGVVPEFKPWYHKIIIIVISTWGYSEGHWIKGTRVPLEFAGRD
jgi:hypothetical protein